MVNVTKSSLTPEQVDVWLRGLLTLAWADGDFDPEEQNLIASLTHNEFASNTDVDSLEPISAEELGRVLGEDPKIAEDFLRTAVMVVLADGIYSVSEDQVLHEFCQSLGLQIDALNSLRHTLEDENHPPAAEEGVPGLKPPARPALDVLSPVKHWLDDWEIHDPQVARFICKMVPPQCPFERDITLFGRKIVHIPPMCKLNPLYEQLVGLRFRALSYLVDDCKEDISEYC